MKTSELSCPYKIDLVQTQFEMKKKGLLKAVKGLGTNERRLVDILAYCPNAEMKYGPLSCRRQRRFFDLFFVI